MHLTEVKQLGEYPGPLVYHCSASIGHLVYVLLGMKPNGKNHTDVHIYNIETGRWTRVKSTGKVPSPRCLSTCCAVGHQIYVFGGYQVHTDGPHTVFNGMYVYDTLEQQWHHLECSGESPDPRAASCMVHYRNQLWIFGGSQGKQVFFGDLFRFDIDRRQWSMQETFGARDRPARLCCHTGVLVQNRLYVFGGLTASESYKDQHVIGELYSVDLDMFTWRHEIQTGYVPHARCCHVSFAVHHMIFVASGGDLLSRSRYDQHVYVCNTAQSNKWTKLTSYFGNYMPKAVGMICGYDTEHHRLVFFGGKNQDNEMLSGVFELPLGKNSELMKELKNQEIEEREMKELVQELVSSSSSSTTATNERSTSSTLSVSKDDMILQERTREEYRTVHRRTRSRSIPPEYLPNVRVHARKSSVHTTTPILLDEVEQNESPTTGFVTTAANAKIPDMIRFNSVETPPTESNTQRQKRTEQMFTTPGGQPTIGSAPVSPELLDLKQAEKKTESSTQKQQRRLFNLTLDSFF